jgi:hypothetical protein
VIGGDFRGRVSRGPNISGNGWKKIEAFGSQCDRIGRYRSMYASIVVHFAQCFGQKRCITQPILDRNAPFAEPLS